METKTTALQRADAYIAAKASAVNQTFRHKLHLMPPIGWMNDPNGFCVYQGEYHLFYQYYPYASVWGPMHWGHAKSKDLISWEDLPVALAPGEWYDQQGIFSGSALEVDGELRVYYTGHSETRLNRIYDENLMKRQEPLEPVKGQQDVSRQVQCLAVSKDGINFDKYDLNPVVDSLMIPEHGRIEDFRDPKVWQHGGRFYMACGSMRKDFIGQVLFYVSDDGLKWQYLNRLTLDRDFGIVWECPDLFELDGKHVLVFSPQNKPRQGSRYENVHSAVALVGHFNHDNGVFEIENIQELDQGFDFYAPQTIAGLDGSRIMVAWMNMWEREYVLDQAGHGWNGSMTLPRKLTLRGNQIYQLPIDALATYHQDSFEVHDQVVEGEWTHPDLWGDVLDLNLSFEIQTGKSLEISFLTSVDDRLVLNFDKNQNLVTLNRMHTKSPIHNTNSSSDFYRSFTMDCSGTIQLRAVLDVSSLELFFNEGEYAMTSLFFPDKNSRQLVFKADGKTLIHDLKRWTMA